RGETDGGVAGASLDDRCGVAPFDRSRCDGGVVQGPCDRRSGVADAGGVRMIRLDALDAPGIAHGFFTRDGGVSDGIYASLNCGWGSGDEPDAVAENRARAASLLGVARDALATNNQVHGVAVVTVE